MTQPLDRRSVIKLAAGGTVAAGLLWSAETADAAEIPASRTATPVTPAADVDTLIFGDQSSETAHQLTVVMSDVMTGGLGQPARVLKPLSTPGFFGGTLTATMACRPHGTTYVTIKLWGSEAGEDLGRLQLDADGKQVGHFHLGPVDPLDIPSYEPRTPGRFFFHTLPLPPALTAGKTQVTLRIRSMGRIFGYGSTPETYYYDLTRPTRGIYRLYTHEQPYFDTAADDVTGRLGQPPVRATPGREVLDTIDTGVASVVRQELNRTSVQSSLDYLDLLARAYALPYTEAYHNAAVVAQIVQSVDDFYRRYLVTPTIVNDNWQGAGLVGSILLQLRDKLTARLDEPLTGEPGVIPNPGFDDGNAYPTGWRTNFWYGSGTVTRDTTVFRTGTASARVEVPDFGVVGLVPYSKIPIGPGKHTYGAWIKTQGVRAEAAYLDVFFYDATGAVVGAETKAPSAGGTTDWQQVTVAVDTPAGAVTVEYQLRLEGAGVAWFDDLTLTPPAGTTYHPVIRRDAWRTLLLGSREHWRQDRRSYTNQSMIVDSGIYLADRGLEIIGAPEAWGELRARRYLYEAVGLAPWLGAEDAAGKPSRPLGGSYHQITSKGLSRELGYVGNYGELQSWLKLIYESVTVFGGVHDDRLRQQLLKIAKTRAFFRHPSLDADGYRTMRYEAPVGWRDTQYPGKRDYDQIDGLPMQLAALFRDPDLLGYVHQMIADNQLFSVLQEFDSSAWSPQAQRNLLTVKRDYEIVTAAAGATLLPMTAGQPGFVFTDEENGVVAVKHGDEIFYASLYWRARWGVNRFARIHHITADGVERSGTIWQDCRFVPDGRTFTEPDWVNWDFGVNGDADIPDGGFPPPGETVHQAYAGQLLPLAAAPPDVPVSAPGVETPFAGRAAFYQCAYGPYLIAMNTTANRTYSFTTGDFGPATNLVNGARVRAATTLSVPPTPQ